MTKHYLINTLVDWRMSLKVYRLKKKYEFAKNHPYYSEMTDEEIWNDIHFFESLGYGYEDWPKPYRQFQTK